MELSLIFKYRERVFISLDKIPPAVVTAAGIQWVVGGCVS